VTRPPRFKIRETELNLVSCHTRIPFRFGAHTLTTAPYATATVTVTSEDGAVSRGASSDLLIPKWFEKDPEKTPQEDSEALAASAALAFECAENLDSASVFSIWREVHRTRVESQPREAPDLLVRGFGVALLERALIDAVCRQHAVSFHDALRSNLFGFSPESIHPELSGWDLGKTLSPAPATSIKIRHTVGLLDALRCKQDEAFHDGFPSSLVEDIRHYGLNHFKIKLSGDESEDLARLKSIAAIFKSEVQGKPRFTFDGNEQFESLVPLANLLESLADSPEGKEFLSGLLFIEQPLMREQTFNPDAHRDIARVEAFSPLLVDEADFDFWAFPAAVAVGYRGISVKACKGIFRALLNFGLCQSRGGGLFQSGEDLTNLPIRALQQDLALMATLNIPHVERNGHHYFRGLDHLPSSVSAEALLHHPDIYQKEKSVVALNVNRGRLDIASLHCSGFGCAVAP